MGCFSTHLSLESHYMATSFSVKNCCSIKLTKGRIIWRPTRALSILDWAETVLRLQLWYEKLLIRQELLPTTKLLIFIESLIRKNVKNRAWNFALNCEWSQSRGMGAHKSGASPHTPSMERKPHRLFAQTKGATFAIFGNCHAKTAVSRCAKYIHIKDWLLGEKQKSSNPEHNHNCNNYECLVLAFSIVLAFSLSSVCAW